MRSNLSENSVRSLLFLRFLLYPFFFSCPHPWVHYNCKKDEKKTVNVFQEPKTKSSVRNITVPAQVMDILKVHKEINNSPEFVFTQQSDKTKPIAPRHFSHTFEKICEKAGLNTTRFHDMRHTYASNQLALNTHMKVVQAQLGHTDIKTTLNRYSHLTQGLQQDAADKLNDKFNDFI